MVVLLVSLARRAYHFQQLASSSTPIHECRTYYLKSGFIIIAFMSMFAVFFFIIGMHFLNRCGNIRFLQEFLEMQLTNASRGTVNARRFQSH